MDAVHDNKMCRCLFLFKEKKGQNVRLQTLPPESGELLAALPSAQSYPFLGSMFLCALRLPVLAPSASSKPLIVNARVGLKCISYQAKSLYTRALVTQLLSQHPEPVGKVFGPSCELVSAEQVLGHLVVVDDHGRHRAQVHPDHFAVPSNPKNVNV